MPSRHGGTSEPARDRLGDTGLNTRTGRNRRRFLVALGASAALALGLVAAAAPAHAAADGQSWTLRQSSADSTWRSVTYGTPNGKGLFVAVAGSGVNARVMTSPDGINWTTRAGVPSEWREVTYGNGRFVAVASAGSKRVMTSTDGITWTARDAAAANEWRSITYGNGTFVAVSQTGAGNRAMTSTDGVTWTAASGTPDNNWQSITYGNSTFVAVGSSGTGNRVMTSTDGLTWTSRTSAADETWQSVTYSAEKALFVAVADSGLGNRVMTSTDGITWTGRTSPANSNWQSVTYGNGVFVAVAWGIVNPKVMTSTDGITWTGRTAAEDLSWWSVAYGQGMFVAVAFGPDPGANGKRVMTSNDAFINQVKDPVDNTTKTDLMQLVPPSGTSTIQRIDIIYNTQARINSDPPPPAPGARWGIWGMNWQAKALTLENSNVIPINLATYQNAGSCVGIGTMKAADCPRPTPMGPVKPGQSQVFRANLQISGTWTGTPNTTITRPAAK